MKLPNYVKIENIEEENVEIEKEDIEIESDNEINDVEVLDIKEIKDRLASTGECRNCFNSNCQDKKHKLLENKNAVQIDETITSNQTEESDKIINESKEKNKKSK